MQEMDARKSRNHWTLILMSDLPPYTKTILAMHSFKRKRFLDGMIQSIRLGYVHMEVCRHEAITIGKHMHLW